MTGNKTLHAWLEEKRPLLTVGAHDGLSGRLGEQAGFDAVWASGFEISASHGVPDANILDMSVQLAAACQIRDAVSVPVIADCDNGYGNAVNAGYTARKFARAGIAGICIEDNIFPKRCSFYAGVRELVSAEEHALKVRACKEETDGTLFVIARTEALIAGHSMAEALDRANTYADAGADAILIHSKEKTPHQIITFAQQWTRSTPLVAVPTTYDTISADELGRLVYLTSLCTTVIGAHLLASYISDKLYAWGFRWEWWSMVSLALFCAGLLLLAFVPNPVMLPVAVVVFICGEVVMTPCFDETAKRHGKTSGMGTCMGLLHLVDGLGRVLGAAFALALYGWIRDTPHRDLYWPIAAGVFLCLSSALHVVARVIARGAGG